MSEDGNLGEGVYCIYNGDDEALKCTQIVFNESAIKDPLYKISFLFKGSYKTFHPQHRIEELPEDVTWCIIGQPIPPGNIIHIQKI